jgi:hypothetical protein
VLAKAAPERHFEHTREGELAMIQIQVVPRAGVDAYQLLRSKVLHEAATWYWGNKRKTRLRHLQSAGHIDVANAGGVLVARVSPKEPRDIFYLAEKFMGRMVAWFEQDLAAIHLQFIDDPVPARGNRPIKRKPVKKSSRR